MIKNSYLKNLLLVVAGSFLTSCSIDTTSEMSISIKNKLNIERQFETVEIDISSIALGNQSLEVKNVETGQVSISQLVDMDLDGKMDLLLFQPMIKPNRTEKFEIYRVDQTDSAEVNCFSRFVPERTDDYAWENNRVAFRTFGPVAQKMVEDGIKGGTLTSGIDAWLKRVDYPIIDKWYEKHTSGKGSYHEDTGEGLDNFHVGVSRGVGGIAVNTDSTYAVSKNFTAWKTITNGPIRTSFILDYQSWDADGKTISERKHISLDYGQNLTRYVVELKGTDNVSIGLTLHEQDGEVTTNTTEGWMSYWEPFDDSELGQGVVLKDKKGLVNFDKYISEKKDQSNLYVQSRVSGTIEYYAGFGWKKSGQFQSKEDWNNYLSRFSNGLDNPLEVKIVTLSK